MGRQLSWMVPTILAVLASACGAHIVHIAPGRPAFRPGAPLAYWVWHGEGGWHLRTTTAGQRHHFHGWITAIDGGIVEVRPTRVERRDLVRIARRGVEFDFETEGGEDGFDWRSSSGCNRFELRVDGRADPRLVHLGGPGNEPAQIPFDRCP